MVLVLLALLATAGSAFAQGLLLSVTPSRVRTDGGTTVELLSTGIFSPTGTVVTINGVTVPHTFHDFRRITFVAPPRPAGLYTLAVTGGGTRPLTYVARTQSGIQGARRPVFSHDGRHMAFESRYALTPGDTNGLVDIYVRTRGVAALRRVSIPSNGGQALGGESARPAISASGRYVAFQSRATNLVPGDTNGVMDVFVHDRDADGDGVFDEAGAVTTERVNLGPQTPGGPAHLQAIGGDSGDPAISGNGRQVVYTSAATNLLGPGVDANQRLDVFAFDRERRLTRLQSTTFDGQLGNGNSRNAAMSLNGRFVAFESLATNFDGGNPAYFDVFLHDRDTDEDGIFDENFFVSTQLVSANPCSTPLDGHSIDPSVTYDGNYVVFATVAPNAKVNENCLANDFNGRRDIYIWDRLGDPPTLRRLSEPNPTGELPGASGAPVISGNGNLLLFQTQAVNAGAPVRSSGLVVAAAGPDGKSTNGQIPSPTTDNPPPPEIPPPPPGGSAEEPSTSGDGNTTGNTNEPDPGVNQSEPMVELEETPPDADGSPFIGGLSPQSGPTTAGTVVQIQGAGFTNQSVVRWNNVQIASEFVHSGLLRVVAPAAPGGFDQAVPVRVFTTGEASNELSYTYQTGLTAPAVTNVTNNVGPTTGNQPVAIIGSGFSNPTVLFGGVPGTGAIVSGGGTRIDVATPPSAAARIVDIVVQNGNGASTVSPIPYVYQFSMVTQAPAVAPVTPNVGPETGGTAITITGSNFTEASTVTVGGVPATDVQVLGPTQIVAVTPPGAPGDAEVVVTTILGPSAPQTFSYLPVAAPVVTCDGADTDGDGMSDAWEVQYGLNPADPLDGAQDPDNDFQTNTQECAALTHPLGHYTRYLAEGATGSFFDTRVVVGNPGAVPARVLVRFLTQTGAVVPHYVVVPAMARRTIDVQGLAGLASANVSSVVASDVQVVVDRTMRWNQQTRQGAHAETSAPAPSLVWFLAEGATHGSFDLFYLIQNPSLTEAAQVRIRYLLPAGAPIEQTITVPANTRATVYVDEQAGLGATDVSAVLESLNAVPIIVERAMYSSVLPGDFAAGHDSAGVTAASTSWFFAEGATGSFFDMFLLFANPNSTPASLRATYLLPSGETITKDYTVPGNSRRTINVQLEDARLAGTAVSVTVTALNGVAFIAERSMWWPHGAAWTEAHNAAGSTATGTKWAVGDGEVGNLPDDTATYILVANTSASAGTVRITLLFESGVAVAKDFLIAANSRLSVPVLPNTVPDAPSHFVVARGRRFSTLVESLGVTPSQIVVERAMYWNAGGQLWSAGSDVLATKLQ